MTTYQEVRRQIESLTFDEQKRLMEELASIVSHRKTADSKPSILDLEGLGKDIWQGLMLKNISIKSVNHGMAEFIDG